MAQELQHEELVRAKEDGIHLPPGSDWLSVKFLTYWKEDIQRATAEAG
jgi:hypothetical protein